jgi:cytochrome c-type biogenesis protein CcmH/NrfF
MSKLVDCTYSISFYTIMNLKFYICITIIQLLFVVPILPQTTTTNTTLTEPEQIREFMESTTRLRCICLPSLPLQSCSYNMCVVSSYLKTFIENQIRAGMKSDEIVYKFEHGFGDSILKDPVVEHFAQEGNQRMIQSLIYGFGTGIQAKPDSTWINLSLILLGSLGLIGILYYGLRKKSNLKEQEKKTRFQNQQAGAKPMSPEDLEKKYLSEL